MNRWYVAQANSTRLAEAHLRRQGVNVFLPEADNALLFPGYVFVQFDINTSRWRHINGTVGVRKLLPISQEMPLPLPNGYVEELMGAIQSMQEGALRPYMPGEMVPVTGGPFAGHDGKMKEYKRGVYHLLMSLLGREVLVKVNPDQVAPRRSGLW